MPKVGKKKFAYTKKEPEISLTKGYYNPETKRYVPSVYQTIKKKG